MSQQLQSQQISEEQHFHQGLTESLIDDLAIWLAQQLYWQPPSSNNRLAADCAHPRVVYLTLADDCGDYVTAAGMGLGLQAAAKVACKKAMGQARQLRLSVNQAKIDVVMRAAVYSPKRVALNQGLTTDESILGFACNSLDNGWLPEETLRYRLLKKNGGIHYKRTRLAIGSRLGVKNLKAKKHRLYGFTTASRYVTKSAIAQEWGHQTEVKPNVLRLYRGHNTQFQVTADVCFARARAGADYLARQIREDGSFRYMYQAGPDDVTDEYNLLRHIGSLWSLLDFYREEPTAEVKAASYRALDYVYQHIDEVAPGVLATNENNFVKLGGNGLGLLTLSLFHELFADKQALETAQGLARWIVNSQNEQGEFTIHKQGLKTGKVQPFISDYYPGEAIFGLMRLFHQDGNNEWRDAAVAASQWLINVRDKGKALVELEHDHWLLYGLNEVYRVSPQPLFIEHVGKLIKAMRDTQHGADSPHMDWRGGWYNPPRTTPAATRCEGLLASWHLLNNHPDLTTREELADLQQMIIRSLHFQFQNQFVGEKLMYLTNPQQAFGGFHSNLTNWHIRIDYVQHSLSAMLAYWRLFREQGKYD
ncbi:MAG: hypothetical protein LAT77_00630 [Aliidiomarina sp.]|uniref:hypothetical protein n=1 Tax=Aliidiomarina sp. TaxID=1872439 RepID=UPI0025BE8B22|nr:hypothetical protein [Aliidiomarina sp.]MCH8500396.1 hypothetical protein [Aliidiomarina sp.]